MSTMHKVFSPLCSLSPVLNCDAKHVVLSGPSGFLGSHVLDSILDVHATRMNSGLDPGEVVLLSGSPGNLMRRLQSKYGYEKMKTVRASRVDYFNQHDIDTWRDHMGSLGWKKHSILVMGFTCLNIIVCVFLIASIGLKGPNCVFVNLAAVAGPVGGRLDAMMDVNYKAPVAAARACADLGFGHWVQSSTQATNSERAGQVYQVLTRCSEKGVLTCCS
jgi:nucleoside-diphosphate-sugar epimerase